MSDWRDNYKGAPKQVPEKPKPQEYSQEWKPIPECNGYEINRKGEIRHITYLKADTSVLYIEGKTKRINIAKLLQQLFP